MPSATKHAPNSSLTLRFAPNFIRLKRSPKSTSAKAARRSPKYIDPSTDLDLEVAVQNTPPNGGPSTSYMAAIDVPIVSTQTETQTVPIYLAPGQDTILAQEVGAFGYGYSISTTSGYLLAQGETTTNVGEGQSASPAFTMQIVMEGVAIMNDVSTYNPAGYMTTNNNFVGASVSASVCLNDNQSIYFLPYDYYGGTYAFGENPGDVSPNDGGIPTAEISSTSVGSSTLTPNPVGGYIASFDSAGDPIIVTASYYAVTNPQTFGPFSFATGSVISLVSASPLLYYAEIGESGSPGCATS